MTQIKSTDGTGSALPENEDEMTLEEFQQVGRQMIADARERFRREALWLCRTDAEREKAIRMESAIGEVSPEEAVLAFRKWLLEQPDDAR